MHHYVYLLEFPDGKKYVGMHSTTIEPLLDACYLGSGKALPARLPETCTKTILGIFDTRQEAANYEIEFIVNNNCVASDEYYNLRIKTHDKHGTKLSPEHREICRKISQGRSRIEYGKKYSGDGRTPAQRAGDKRAAEKIRGTKCPAKSNPGATNGGFSSWYYITPAGEYVEVHDVAKQDYADYLGVTARQLGHRFHYSNEHKVAKTKPLKGWTFGNLPKPT